MKRLFYLIIILGVSIGFYSCESMDLDPMSSLTTGNWYKTVDEIEIGVNEAYRMGEGWQRDYWADESYMSELTDDANWRDDIDFYKGGTMTSEEGYTGRKWDGFYQLISRMNNVLAAAEALREGGETSQRLAQLIGEIHFFRAYAYSKLVFFWGDVPLIKQNLTITEGMSLGRTPKSEVMQFVYDEFDLAASVLPATYQGTTRVTKGAALALKARFALYMGDYALAETEAKKVIDSGVYSLHPDYGDLFQPNTKNTEESIFEIPRNLENQRLSWNYLMGVITRNNGGWNAVNPSFELFASYTCTDGLPIDESPLFDPKEPFKNRDPRCAATIVEFGTRHLYHIYQPHPDSVECWNFKTNSMVPNQDCRKVKTYASFNGLAWKKGFSEEYLDMGWRAQNSQIISRYADVLLIYAEARIEQNKIDQSTLDAMNTVRARAYGVTKNQTDKYPAITETNQTKLRAILRTERRVEFAYELYYRNEDLIRWRYCEIVFNRSIYTMKWDVDEIDRDAWFWPSAPAIDDVTGLPDISTIAHKLDAVGQCKWNNRQYLWPIPSTEVIINENMTQNPGY